MRRAAVVLLCCLLRAAAGSAAGREDPKPVLAAMNKAPTSVKSAQADFEWVTYNKLADEKEVQKGRIFFRRGGDDVDVALHIETPVPKRVVYHKGMLRIYEPKIRQLTKREVGKDKADKNAVISLGFGGNGDELAKAFEVALDEWQDGRETVDQVKTAKLELVPKSPRLKKLFSKATLWIDPVRAVPLQQQFFAPSGDYELTRYANIKVNAPVSDDDFIANPEDLKPVLAAMNQASANFKSAKADCEWTNYNKLVDEKDVQNGRIYFRRAGSDEDVALHIESPGAKQVVYQKGVVRMYEPKIDQLTVREVGKNKADLDAVISLGFGGNGDELAKDFEVAMEGWETVDRVKTAKLELVPRSPSLKKLFSKVILWIDPARDVPLQQQWFFEPSGDYKLTRYTNIKVNANAKVSDDDFKLHTTSKTKVVKLQ